MELIQLNVVGISYSNKVKPNQVLILGEADGTKRIPIVIGYNESNSIVNSLMHATQARPNTHDLMSNILDICGLKLRNVVIYKMQNDIFYSRLIITNEKDKIMLVETRTSDAVALALRQNAPILATRDVMDAAPTMTDEDIENLGNDREIILNRDEAAELNEKYLDYNSLFNEPDVKEDGLNGIDDKKLEEMMNEAISAENYELASKLKTEIERRKGS